MKSRLIAALLIVSLTGCSVAPRAAPPSTPSAPVAATSPAQEERSDRDVPPETGPGMTETQKIVLLTILLVALTAITYAITRTPYYCCYR